MMMMTKQTENADL